MGLSGRLALYMAAGPLLLLPLSVALLVRNWPVFGEPLTVASLPPLVLAYVCIGGVAGMIKALLPHRNSLALRIVRLYRGGPASRWRRPIAPDSARATGATTC